MARNRIILIGNGFDLAHGLKTSFEDFLVDLIKTDAILLMNNENSHPSQQEFNSHFIDRKFDVNKKSLVNIGPGTKKRINELDSLKELSNYIFLRRNGSMPPFTIKTVLLKEIVLGKRESNWCDIEWQYFKCLIERKEDTNFINLLNDELTQLTYRLKDYINRSAFEVTPITGFNSIINANSIPCTPERTLIVNFNYTNTLDLYLDNDYSKQTKCSIHGSADSENKEIIFGYGDETTETYKVLEDLNNNELLRFIKSFYYKTAPEYNRIVEFINRKKGYHTGLLDGIKYNVEILGHSCGLSDRVLLKEIFEHTNCEKIIIHNHDKGPHKDSKVSMENNFRETFINLSRHFDKNLDMRHKIAEFDRSKRIPQFDDKNESTEGSE